MARIFLDPYAATASPISDAVSKIGMSILANRKSPEELAYLQSRRENADLENEKLRRDFGSRDEVAGYAADQNFDPAKFAAARAAWIRGGNISNLGDLLRVMAYTQNGAPVAVRDSSFMGAGGNAQGTETGHAKTLQNALQQTGMQVAGANARNERSLQVQREIEEGRDARTLLPVVDETGALVMRPKSEVGKPGFLGTPVLSKDLFTPTQGPLGLSLQPNMPGLAVPPSSDKAQPFNIRTPGGQVVMSRDGLTDLQGGTIPPGSQRFGVTTNEPIGQGEAKALRDTAGAQEKLAANITDLRGLISNNPASLGAVGNFRRSLQDVLQQGDAAAQAFGVNLSAIRDAASRADAQLAKNFDPSLPQIDLMANVIAYQAASVFAGQQGRDVSNRDFQIWRGMLGDDFLLGNTSKMTAGLDMLERMLGRDKAATSRRLGQPAPAGAPSAPEAPPRVPRYNPQTRTIE
jgi:hypothetical protein